LNPGFKVVSQASPSAEDYSFRGVDFGGVDPLRVDPAIDPVIAALVAATIKPRTGRDFAPDLFYPVPSRLALSPAAAKDRAPHDG